jgi:hypothetical protein
VTEREKIIEFPLSFSEKINSIIWDLYKAAILFSGTKLVVVIAEQEIEGKSLICLSSLLSAA